MPYVLKMMPPHGGVEYIPEGFGYTVHEHTQDKTCAKRFSSKADALRYMGAYVHPPCFWESERRHREMMENRFRGWSFEAEEVAR